MQKLIYGFHSTIAFLRSSPERAVVLYTNSERQDQRMQDLLQLAQQAQVKIQQYSNEKLEQLVGGNVNHQGVVLAITGFNEISLDNFLQQSVAQNNFRSIVLVLDGITDPHNLGSIIRAAECFGVNAIIVPKDNSANYTSEVVAKTSSGAVYYLPIIVVNNITRALEKLKTYEYWVAGTALADDAVNLFEFQPTAKIAWIMGNEATGIRRLVKETCDYLVMIPQYGCTQSLNVAVATGVVLSYTRNCWLQK